VELSNGNEYVCEIDFDVFQRRFDGTYYLIKIVADKKMEVTFIVFFSLLNQPNLATPSAD
jgi:hypothetical protein